MKFIKLTSCITSSDVFINAEMIGHIYSVSKNPHGTEKVYTCIGHLTHNNGGFSVQETVEEVLTAIAQVTYCKS